MNPLTDQTGQFGAVNQPIGNVWFLAGNGGGATVRTVTIPAGKALFFPVANVFDVETACRDDHVDPALAPLLQELGGRLSIRDDRGNALRRHERKERRAPPFRVVEHADHALAHVGHLVLDPNLFGVEIHQSPLEADSACAEEALADARRS